MDSFEFLSICFLSPVTINYIGVFIILRKIQTKIQTIIV